MTYQPSSRWNASWCGEDGFTLMEWISLGTISDCACKRFRLRCKIFLMLPVSVWSSAESFEINTHKTISVTSCIEIDSFQVLRTWWLSKIWFKYTNFYENYQRSLKRLFEWWHKWDAKQKTEVTLRDAIFCSIGARCRDAKGKWLIWMLPIKKLDEIYMFGKLM